MFSKAPVAFLCTLISFDFASLVKGPKAPDLAIFMGCQVRDAANRIALYLDIRRHHLADKRRKPTKLHNKYFVFRYNRSDNLSQG
jgi:hypothetical protein